MNFLHKLFKAPEKRVDGEFNNRLSQAVNIFSINAIVFIFLSALYGKYIFKNETSLYVLFVCPFYLTSFILNRLKYTMWACSFMFITSSSILAFYCIRTGEEAYTQINFTLLITGISLMFRRKENRLHFYVNTIYLFLCLILVFFSYQTGFLNFLLDPRIEHEQLRQLNFAILLMCSIIFSSVITVTHESQQNALEQALQEQKVLLAEVNHRVKNNLTIIVSLLNIQMNNSNNKETKNAIQVVHNRIMSMALVHQKMYHAKNTSAFELDIYITELVREIKNSISFEKEIEFKMNVDSINIDVSIAIPLGLILNEIITNAIKHAFDDTLHPHIIIDLKKIKGGMIELIVVDNGKGMELNSAVMASGMGLNLIEALTDQIDGKCNFENENENGLTFHLSIPISKD